MKELYTMSIKELSRLEILQKLLIRQWKQEKAAEVLGIGVRQVQRLVSIYREHGPAGLISKKRGKPSNRRLGDVVKSQAISLIRRYYPDFGPTLATEKLYEKHNIKLSVETVRNLMIINELWKPRNTRLKRSYQPRYRRERFGELIQIDGSSHDWFEGRGPKCTLLVYVDDATSKLTSHYFAPSESTHTYFLATKQHLKRYGKPMAFYSDRLSVFKVHPKSTQDKIMTQFGRGLYELNIDLICANTCQAKGRVERANLTLQDRLIKELRLRNISTISEANAYLPAFMEDYNKRFGKIPVSGTDAHRSLLERDSLEESLCFKQDRTVTQNLTIQYDRVLYLIEDTLANRALRRKKIMLHEYPDGTISLNHEGRRLNFTQMYDRVKEPTLQGRTVSNERISSVLEVIEKGQKERKYKRSTGCPRRNHLIAPSPKKAEASL